MGTTRENTNHHEDTAGCGSRLCRSYHCLPQRTAPVQFPGQCKVCTDAVEIMEILLKDYGPEEAVVKAAIEGICAKLPLWSDQCKSIVDTVIDFIDQNKAPEDICNIIKACPEPQL